MKYPRRIFVTGLVVLVLFSLSACVRKPEQFTLKIGTQPWIGYGPWWIAQEKGLFEKHGLKVELVNFTEDKEVNAALASGEMQAANVGNYQGIRLFNSGLDIRVILMEDISYKADAILAPSTIKSIQDLKGKKVAYEEGSVHDVLINYALQNNGLTLKDIQPVFMPAATAGATLIAGKVDAAITYEPYVSEALKNKNDLHILYTAAERPGIISDVLVVSTKFLEENPEKARTLLQVWDEAMSYYKNNPEDAKSIIAKAVGSSPEDLKTAFDGIKLFDLTDNRRLFDNEFKATLTDGAQVAQKIGVLDKNPDLNKLLDDEYLGK